MIRGLGTQLIHWSPGLLDALAAAGLRVVTFDNRDVGESTWLDHLPTDRPTYTLRDMAGDVVGLLDALGIDRAHILGISMGGMIAQHVAMGWPGRVASLISVMSSTGNPALPRPPAEVIARLRAAPESGSAEDIVAFTADSEALWDSPGFPSSVQARRAMARAAFERAWHPDGEARQMQAVIADGSRVARLASVSCPTLVVHGRDDVLVPLAGGEDTARSIPGAELVVIDGMGHNLPPALDARLAGLIARHVQAVGG